MTADGVVDDLRLFTKSQVAERVNLSERRLEELAADPACPLKFVRPRHGKGKVCTPAVLRAFVSWLVTEPDVKVGA